MNACERTLLIQTENRTNGPNGLSLFFAIICVIDVFGVFPLVTLPKAVIDCGFYGILVILIVCPVQIFTATLLGRCWVIAEEMFPMIHRKNRYPYSALAEVTYGKRLSSFVTLLLDLTVFGGGIPNLIVASQNLQLLCLRISNGNIYVSHCYWIIILGMILCPILWLGSPKDMKCICSLSVFIVFSVFLVICGCLLFSSGADPSDIREKLLNMEKIPLWKSMLTTYGILAFQFDIHPTILTIQVDMKEKSKLTIAVIAGFVVTLFMFGVITIMASIKYGTFTQSSVLGTVPSTISLHFAAALIALQLCLTSAVSNNALYQHLEDCLCISREVNIKRCILRSILTLLAVVLAELVPRFDILMSFIGGTLTGPLIFILPPLLYLKILELQSKHEEELATLSFANIVFRNREEGEGLTKYMEHKFKEEEFRSSLSLTGISSRWKYNNFEKVFCLLIIVFSTFTTMATTYLNFTSMVLSYSVFTAPCIYNVSSALLHL